MVKQNDPAQYQYNADAVEFFAITLGALMLALAAFVPQAELLLQFTVGTVAVIAWVLKFKDFALFASCFLVMLLCSPALFWLFTKILSIPYFIHGWEPL
ncbi:hypothetical protein [Photobacterium ganghwense]|uniref:hypothetical protein n=1 Tax=Photobacterium ganghwense TaxID=320778 RepID=UPI001A8FFE88|nr:hypothetical protein [Photobacterium ganghwense]QSV17561.1 hypothetical protein FH974_26005 [Photobacterium ganghwense]